MKKIILSTLVLSTSLFALSDTEILSIYDGAPNDIKKEIKKSKIPDLPGFDVVEIMLSKGEQSQKEIMFANENFIFPDIIDPKKGISYKEIIEQASKIEKVSAVYKNENSDYIVKLGNDPKKETMIVFTDADCPYCRRAMGDIENILKNHNIEIIMTSVHGNDSHAKSWLIYQDAKKAKTDVEKIAVLRKYYDEKFSIESDKVSPENIKKMSDLAKRYHEAGVSSVPHFMKKSDLILVK